jgi:hypothetical protein
MAGLRWSEFQRTILKRSEHHKDSHEFRHVRVLTNCTFLQADISPNLTSWQGHGTEGDPFRWLGMMLGSLRAQFLDAVPNFPLNRLNGNSRCSKPVEVYLLPLI